MRPTPATARNGADRILEISALPTQDRKSDRTVGSKRTALNSEPAASRNSKTDSVIRFESISDSSRVRIAKSNRLRPRSLGLSSATWGGVSLSGAAAVAGGVPAAGGVAAESALVVTV